jgi:hypothetical protein
MSGYPAAIEIVPLTLREANGQIREWHRHHDPVPGCRFSIGAMVDGVIAGVLIVESATAPAFGGRLTRIFEVSRVATPSENASKNVASKLLGAARRSALEQGFRRGISYIRTDEKGTSYLAAGWHRAATVKADTHNHGNRGLRWLPGLFVPTTEVIDRVRWETGPDCACSSCAAVKEAA